MTEAEALRRLSHSQAMRAIAAQSIREAREARTAARQTAQRSREITRSSDRSS